MQIDTIEPAELTVGDTWSWRRDTWVNDYPANAGWVLTYRLIGKNGAITITATADGASFLINVAAATTAAYVAGTYAWAASVTKASEKYTLDNGTIVLKPNLTAIGTTDLRGFAEKALESIEAVLSNRATVDQQSFEIAGRKLSRTPITDLLKLRDTFRREVKNLKDAEAIAKGLGTKRTILARFTKV